MAIFRIIEASRVAWAQTSTALNVPAFDHMVDAARVDGFETLLRFYTINRGQALQQ